MAEKGREQHPENQQQQVKVRREAADLLEELGPREMSDAETSSVGSPGEDSRLSREGSIQGSEEEDGSLATLSDSSESDLQSDWECSDSEQSSTAGEPLPSKLQRC